jgi:hypothetical protein
MTGLFGRSYYLCTAFSRPKGYSCASLARRGGRSIYKSRPPQKRVRVSHDQVAQLHCPQGLDGRAYPGTFEMLISAGQQVPLLATPLFSRHKHQPAHPPSDVETAIVRTRSFASVSERVRLPPLSCEKIESKEREKTRY